MHNSSFRFNPSLNFRCLLLIWTCLGMCGCSTGYQQSGGQYVWVTWDEARGRREHPIKADEATFKVLACKEYAIDKNTAFYKDRRIIDADPATFRVLSDSDFACDKNHVYLWGCTVVGADPKTFKSMSNLYGADKNQAYSGTVPIRGVDPQTFAAQPESGLSYLKFTEKDDFLERFGPDYADIEVSKERPAIVTFGTAFTAGKPLSAPFGKSWHADQ